MAAGFFGGVLAGGFVLTAIAVIWELTSPVRVDLATTAKIMAPISFAGVFVVMLAAGLPTYQLLRRRGWMRAGHFALAGALVGLLAFAVFSAHFAFGPDPGFPLYPVLMIGPAGGAAAAFVFWLIAVPRQNGAS